MKRYLSLLFLSVGALGNVAHAALTPEQKAIDFEGMVATLDRRYAPIELVSNGDTRRILRAQPWIEAAKQTGSDAEFYRLQLQYLARFGHAQDTLDLDGGYRARLGITVDYYDNELLIDSIDRNVLPATQYPFQIGDQLVAVDGRPIAAWLAIYSPLVASKKLDVKRTTAANLIVSRRNMLPFAPEKGQAAQITVRRGNGAFQQYTLNWQIKGPPIDHFANVPLVYQVAPPEQPSSFTLRYFLLRQMPAIAQPAVGVGARDPLFVLPAGFQQRSGGSASDFFFSGTYQAGGRTIGFLRIGTFYPSSALDALAQLKTEIQYLNANTDGLVLDITRNHGGDANYQDDVARLLFPTPFKTLPEQIRPTLTVLGKVSSILQEVQNGPRPDPALYAHVKSVYDEVNSAYTSGKRLTPPVYPRNVSPYLQPSTDAAGNVIAYSKPIVLLVDVNTACGAEAFTAVFKDNRRGVVAGMTTLGVGGDLYVRVRGARYSESLMSFPGTLFVRTQPVQDGKKSAPAYIQNAGVKPDATLNYMTKANLISQGKPFVDGFTKLIVNRIY